MKTAIFHSFMDNIGGAERVCLILARELGADIYTTNIDRDKVRRMGFPDVKILSIGEVPVNAPFRHQLALWRFRGLDLGNTYDRYIIGGDWAVSAAVNHHPNLWYVHSPIREIWDLYPYTRKKTVPASLRGCFDVWVHTNRILTRAYIRQVDRMVCNSRNTQNRIRTYLSRDAEIVHPPVETREFRYGRNGNFWLSVNRLISHKRVDLQIRAFQRMPEQKLVIVGSYEQSRHFRSYADYIRSIKPANVSVFSWVHQEDLLKLYADCRGFLATALDEDFGLTPVEAMAAGKPVIAPADGGFRETVLDGVTGRLLDRMDEDSLLAAVRFVGQDPGKYRPACEDRARAFDTKIFVSRIKTLMGH
ncbi:MAG: glycosyltransferase [Candidatus Omnitrophota bacterium]|nr:glycosyltransferase [Candidatus Omnitrophota bacterium]MDZ4243408.1 glycosyltransferase [Candidatus Omnitrophota bacterium]